MNFPEKLFSVKKMFVFLWIAIFSSIFVAILNREYSDFHQWLYKIPFSGSAWGLKLFICLLWLFPLTGLVYNLYTQNWKSNLPLLLKTFLILLMTISFLLAL